MVSLSLVVPVYNMEKYLSRCMNTLLFQTSNNYEIILVNDGSTDNSGSICDEYGKKYPNLIRVIHKENGGLSSARNAGICEARGKFVVFPDPDDWVEFDYVEQFLKLQKEVDADLVCTGYFVNYDDRQLSALSNQKKEIFNGKEAQRALLISPKMSGFAWNKIYRLDIIKKHNLHFLDDVGTTEDLDFVYRHLKYCNRIVFDPNQRTYHYYQREGAATRSGFTVHKMNSLHTYEKIMADTDDVELRSAAKDEFVTMSVNLLWMYENSETENKALKKQLLINIKDNLTEYMKSKNYGIGRKMQALLALLSPKIYCILKNSIQK